MVQSNDVWWIQQESNIVTMGFQPNILKKWGQLRFLDLPLSDVHLIVGDRFVTVEARQSLTYATSPVAGTITAINPQLNGWVKAGTDTSQWLVKVRLDAVTEK